MSCRTAASDYRTAHPPASLPPPLAWIEESFRGLRETGLERPRRMRSGRQGALITLDGRELLNFGSNDYLGYAGDVRLTKAASKGSCAEGFGAGASPLVSGHSANHELLEQAVAGLLGAEAALVFPSGFAANAATIPALVGADDFIASDARNHASIIDGCRLSRARIGIYPHRDMAALDALLASVPGRRRLVVTDTLFSMDGTIAPLADLCAIAEKHGAMLLVDEAHATGVFGMRGSGLVEALGCGAGVHLRIGTLSKALGAAGGFVAGQAAVIDWLRHTARAWIFSTAHPPGVAAAARRAIGLLAEEPERRSALLVTAEEVRGRLRSAGLSLGDAAAQILPVAIGSAERAVAVGEALAAAGLFVPPIRPPSVPVGRSLLRVSLSWLHEPEQIRRLVETLVSHVR
jgi:8-amino-7-oxononanoate synthase